MTIALRPHHFLCLPGYKGYNYNKEQVSSWDTISKQLNENPDTDILILGSKDDLCKKCPNDGVQSKATCLEKNVSALDKKVQDLLGLVTGQVYKYSNILKKLHEVMTPEKHAELCSGCAWWKKGLCHDTFAQSKAPFLSVTASAKFDPSKVTYIPPKKQDEEKAA